MALTGLLIVMVMNGLAVIVGGCDVVVEHEISIPALFYYVESVLSATIGMPDVIGRASGRVCRLAS